MTPNLNRQRDSVQFSIPRTTATARLSRDGIWALTVVECPFCGNEHRHGGGDDSEPSFGTRVAHCINGRGVYELAPLEYDLPDEGDQPDGLHEISEGRP